MSQSVAYEPADVTARDRTHTLFAQTMGYVAATTGLFALGAYLGRNLSAPPASSRSSPPSPV